MNLELFFTNGSGYALLARTDGDLESDNSSRVWRIIQIDWNRK
jgi:hypothetical protein